MPKLRFLDPNTITVAAIDAGIKHTGISLWMKSQLHSVTDLERDVMTSDSPARMADMIEQHIRKTVKNGVLLVVEDYGYGGGFFNAMQPEIVGVLKARALDKQNNLAGIVFIPPNTVKKRVTGNGDADKNKVRRAVIRAGYGGKNRGKDMSTHSADSIALFLTYLQLWNQPTESMYRRAVFIERPDN